MASDVTPGLPDPNDTFFIRVQIGRNPGKDRPEKMMTNFSYPNLKYGAMVVLQEILVRGAMNKMVELGHLTAAGIGQDIVLPDGFFG